VKNSFENTTYTTKGQTEFQPEIRSCYNAKHSSCSSR